jgi:ribosomal protein L37E
MFKCFRCGKAKHAERTKMLAAFGTGREAALFIQEYMKAKWETENGPR